MEYFTAEAFKGVGKRLNQIEKDITNLEQTLKRLTDSLNSIVKQIDEKNAKVEEIRRVLNIS
jgi:prefoldin subunit 5